jgi:hypothetical protein
MKWILYGIGLAVIIGGLAWLASRAPHPQSTSVARNDSVGSAPRDIDNEIRAYEKASEDFRSNHRWHVSGGQTDSNGLFVRNNPEVASYSPSSVLRKTDGRFLVTVIYAGAGRDGNDGAQATRPYLIRCESGLCFVDARP